MNDDISGLLRGNLPEPPPGKDFGPKARGIRRRRQVTAGVAAVALVAIPLGWGVTQIGRTPQVYTTPTATMPATTVPTGEPTAVQTLLPTGTSAPATSGPTATPTTPRPSETPTSSTVTPEPSDTPTSSPSQTPSATPKATQTFGASGKAEFSHFTVELKPITSEGSGQYPNFEVEVCVVKPADPNPDGTTRVSPNPWLLTMSDGTDRTASPSTEFSPAFPAESRLMPGECASGWLEFRGGDASTASQELAYENSVGERAEWTFG